jgi:hypothetical protein
MKQKQNPKTVKVKKTETIIFRVVITVTIIGIMFFVILAILAGLTRAGYIENYLNIRILDHYRYPDDFRGGEGIYPMKPVIYLYPKTTKDVDVKLLYKGELSITYPEYRNGWNVRAYPDGRLINLYDGKEYSYLFWEGSDEDWKYDLTTGFVVEGNNTVKFLQDKLSELGLTSKEYNEFIVYWLPQMINNKYNLIHFASKEEYDDRAELVIDPKPDSMLRVFMVFKALDKPLQLEPQSFTTFERKGFSVVEWGGSEIK